MSAPSMNITESEFQREVEALKSHRRLSVNRPIVDPDLPDLAAVHGGGQELLSVPSPEREREWRGVNLVDEGAIVGLDASSRPLAQRKGSGSERARFTARRRGLGADRPDSPDSIAGRESARSPSPSSSLGRRSSRGGQHDPSRPQDPSHLFWVPASVHPEISPADFRNFLKDHAARTVVSQTELAEQDPLAAGEALPLTGHDSPIANRINSLRRQNEGQGDLISRSTSLSRRGSTLRRQYRPENDADDDDDNSINISSASYRVGSQRSARGGAYGANVPTLTIDDLQKLEQLAEEASKSDDPTQLRNVLRRTLSINTSPLAFDQADDVRPVGEADDADAPIIVPRPGQILRRAVRTKIRKASLSGDNRSGSPAPRRSRGSGSPAESEFALDGAKAVETPEANAAVMQRRPSDQSEISSGAEEESSFGESSRPQSDEATDSIVDAYSRDSYHSDASQRTSLTSLADTFSDGSIATAARLKSRSPSPPRTPTQASIATASKSGYFDIADDSGVQPTVAEGGKEPKQEGAATGSTPTLLAGSAALSDSPMSSPSHEKTPVNANQIKPIPVSYVPPMPAFEKTTRKPPAPASIKSSTTAPNASTTSLQHQSRAASAGQQTSRRAATAAAGGGIAAGTAVAANAAKATATTASPTASVTPVAAHTGRPRPVSPPPQRQKDKERKAGFGLSWFGLGKDDDDERDRASKLEKEERKKEKYEKRERKEREKEEEREKEKEKDSSSFLGALFGKKRGQDDGSPHAASAHKGFNNGQITAGSLLDRNAMGAYGRGGMSSYRYPIHIERAVYRLSHIKLANPRRPLYEQVLISNLMFWYLSVINQSQQQQQQLQKHQQQQQQLGAGQDAVGGRDSQVASMAHGLTPAGAAAAIAAGAMPAPVPGAMPLEGSANRHDTAPVESGSQYSGQDKAGASHGGLGASVKQRRSGLTKPDRAPAGSSRGRAAEMPMKQPGYGVQHQQINDDLKTMSNPMEYGGLGQGSGIAEQIASAGGFTVGQVVDTQTLHANTPYRLLNDGGTAPAKRGHDTWGSADDNGSGADYLGLGDEFGSTAPLWSGVGIESGGADLDAGAAAEASASSTASGESAKLRDPAKELDSGAWMGGKRRSDGPLPHRHVPAGARGRGRMSDVGVSARPLGGSIGTSSGPSSSSSSLSSAATAAVSPVPSSNSQRRSESVQGSSGDHDGRPDRSDHTSDPAPQAWRGTPSSDSPYSSPHSTATQHGSDDLATNGWHEDALVDRTKGQLKLAEIPNSSAVLEAARTSQSRRR